MKTLCVDSPCPRTAAGKRRIQLRTDGTLYCQRLYSYVLKARDAGCEAIRFSDTFIALAPVTCACKRKNGNGTHSKTENHG